jgi:hypothetical protein
MWITKRLICLMDYAAAIMDELLVGRGGIASAVW